jgi:pimeloyl-ACP methyl ester carboxylesterase
VEIDLAGVRTWYAEHGAGKPLVYLHGGISDAAELDPVLNAYADRFRVLTPERRGHGHTPDTPGPFDFTTFADDTAAFLEAVVGGPADLVGYSDGATTALHVALRRPDLVRRLVLISGQYHADGLLPELFGNDPEVVVAGLTGSPMAAHHAQVSPDGPEHFPVLVRKVLELARTQPRLDVAALAAVRARTLVVSGDDDGVALEHTLALYRGIPDAELAVVPGTSHVLLVEKPALLTRLVLGFLTEEPVATIAPIRRARDQGWRAAERA